jgi:hypothetical protein
VQRGVVVLLAVIEQGDLNTSSARLRGGVDEGLAV